MPTQLVLRPFYSSLLRLPNRKKLYSLQTHLLTHLHPRTLPQLTLRTASTMPKPKQPTPPENFPTHSFPDASSFESFLETNHSTLPGLYLKLTKKSSGIPSITAPEAVEVALCFGWIDGRANSLADGIHWTVRYTPRRAKSMWSAKNVATIARLIEEGRMRPAGMEVVESAKADGRWERAYDGPASIEVPKDLEEALKEVGNEKAREFLEGLNRSDRYGVLHRLQTAPVSKREERVKAVVEMLAKGEVSNGARKATAKAKVQTKTKTLSTTAHKVVKKGKEKAVVKSKVDKTTTETTSKQAKSSVATGSTRQLRSRTGPVDL
ncbi:hypothetical protein BJX68DRAFT_232628 [Aspergillus pseudodeflectus]|uniref:Bacteriocin-protection, YdeI or OmpD-associated-domain-containing protein n=1 Tax=Aspergillus pseudodeflectus TaxID=176178 RepID=A0ABR4KPN6_9EURO